MDRLGWLPTRYITPRGWGMIATAVAVLLLAQILGRRDLLVLAVFLAALPLTAAGAMVLLKPGFAVERRFRPPSVETGLATQVHLALRRNRGFGMAYMEEQLPARFGNSPSFRFPARFPSATGASVYEYRLRSARRGVFAIGPVTADFQDPFGLARHRHNLGEASRLVVTPAPLELPATSLTAARGTDGTATTRRQANPSDDDVMTREYRHGDPMRRVHWPATARQGELMVRQEESVTTPQATIILDQRAPLFESGFLPSHGGAHADDGGLLHTSPSFEWAITAVVSAAHDFIQRNYTVRLLDCHGEPGTLRSPSAPWPGDDSFTGLPGYQGLAEGLAALGLAGETHRRPERPHAETDAFGDRLMDKLAAHKLKGPLLAVLGDIGPDDAARLAPAAEFGSHAFALVVCDRPHDSPALQALRDAGWRAVAVSAKASHAAAWSHFDDASPVSAATARRGWRRHGAAAGSADAAEATR